MAERRSAQSFSSSFRKHETVRKTFTSRPLGLEIRHCESNKAHHVAEVETSTHEDVPAGSILLTVNGKDCANDSSTFEGINALIQSESLPLSLKFALPSELPEHGHDGLGKKGRHGADRRVSFFATKADRRRRGCTDVIWLWLFVAFWAGMFGFAALGVREGDPYRLLYGSDHNGEVCGRGSQAGKHELYFPQLQKDLLRAYTANPKKYNPFDGGDPSLVRFFGVCVDGCPQRGDTVCTNATADATSETCFPVPINTTSMLFRCLPFDDVVTTRTIECAEPPGAISTIKCGSFLDCQAKLEARLVHEGTDCTRARIVETKTTEKLATLNPIFDMVTASTAIVRRWFGDLVLSMTPVLLCGGVLSLALAIFYLILLEYFASQIVWGSFMVCYGMLLGLTYVLGSNSGLFAKTQDQAQAAVARAYTAIGAELPAADVLPSAQSLADAALEEEEQVYLQHASRLLMLACVIFLFVMMNLRRRISLAIDILRVASDTLQRMKWLLFFPLVPIAAAMLLMFYWVVIAFHLASVGNVNENNPEGLAPGTAFANATTPQRVLVTDERINGALVYHLFGLYWAKHFLHAVCVCVVAGAVSDFYTLRKENEDKLRPWPVWESLKRVCRYHLGSLALGSLILTVVSFLNHAQQYLDRKTQALQEKHCSVKIAMCMLKCFVKCLTSCVGSISNMGFILLGIQGSSFCASCRQAVKLVFHSGNLATIGTTAVVSNFVLHLGILIVVMISTITITVLLREPFDTSKMWWLNDLSGGLAKVSSPLLPVFMTLLLSYFVCRYAFSVYEMTIDTVMMCYVLDKKQEKACLMQLEKGHHIEGPTLFAPDYLQRVQDHLEGPAKKLKFKHFESKRVGVDWVPKTEADYACPPDEDESCCWPRKSGGDTVRESELSKLNESGGSSSDRFPESSMTPTTTAVSIKTHGGAALDSV